MLPAAGLATPAQAAVNPNPIRWTIFKPFLPMINYDYEDVPLRYGQNDAGPIDGFGTRHIGDEHGPYDWNRAANDISKALNGTCVNVSGNKVRCYKRVDAPQGDYMIVV